MDMYLNKTNPLTIVNHGEEQWLELYDGDIMVMKLTSSQYYPEEAVAETLRLLGFVVETDDLDF